MEDFHLFLRYKNKTIKFKITDPTTGLVLQAVPA